MTTIIIAAIIIMTIAHLNLVNRIGGSSMLIIKLYQIWQ